MRILILNHRDITHPQAGGLEQIVHQTAAYWVKWGHSVDILCAGFPGSEKEVMIDGIRCMRGPNEYMFHVWAPFKVLSLGQTHYDVILEYISKVPCLLPLFIHRTPVAVMIPHLFGRTIFEELPWTLSMAWCAYERMIPWVYRTSSFYVNSQSTARDLRRRHIPAKRIRVIYAGLPEDLFIADPSVQKTPYPSIIAIGRLKQYKHVDYILQAVALLLPRFPTLRLRVVGRGEREQSLRALAQSLQIEHAVEFCGFVEESQKKRMLQESWVGAQTSSNEGWGLAVTEAGACSVPTVASDSPGLRESVHDGETGFVVEHGNINLLAEKIAVLLTNQDLRSSMGRAAHLFATEFSWEKTAAQSLQFLEESLAQVRPQRAAASS